MVGSKELDMASLFKAHPTSVTSIIQYILTVFFPSTASGQDRNSRFLQCLALISAIYYLGPVAHVKRFWAQFSSLFTSTITVNGDDDLFSYFTTYLATVRAIRTDRTLRAASSSQCIPSTTNGDLLSLSPQTLRHKSVIHFEKARCLLVFWQDRRIFFTTWRNHNTTALPAGSSRAVGTLTTSTLGRDTTPIKNLLRSINDSYKVKERTSFTVIRRPAYSSRQDHYPNTETGRYNSAWASSSAANYCWIRAISKPCRNLNTVILRADQKEEIVRDIARYMSRRQRNFYHSHGIPYRRGYLFCGPPGTGKTSLALALAGHFGLDVYILSLVEMKGDEQLTTLMSSVPANCILLLEDVDAAGLKRLSKTVVSSEEDETTTAKPDAGSQVNETICSSQTQVDDLSGLLNAIDGIAAPEGHILVMTTNKPEDLDDALIRAGRVNVRVGFERASKEVAEGVFLKLYLPIDEVPIMSHATGDKAAATGSQMHDGNEADVRHMAKEFADQVEDGEFSPADLQDYFLARESDPRKAVNELEKLREQLKSEEERKRVAQSQRLKSSWKYGSTSNRYHDPSHSRMPYRRARPSYPERVPIDPYTLTRIVDVNTLEAVRGGSLRESLATADTILRG